jgi:hypothetical protein
MAEPPASNGDVNSEPKPGKLLSPKRGAIPTPKADIAMAPSFIPPAGEAAEESGTKPVPPPETEDEEERQQEHDAS